MNFSKSELFLKDFHERFPGCTSLTMAASLINENKSSYALLADLVPVTSEKVSVLDLACGDGYLLSLLQMRQQKGLEIQGIDLSEAELKAARVRLGPQVPLHMAKAQELPISNSSLDVVTCHMAFMLMDSVEKVLEEVGRVLRSGGVFSAVISGEGPQNPINEVFRSLLRSSLKTEDFDLLKQIGDPRLGRLNREEDIRGLFKKEFRAPVEIKKLVLKTDTTIDGATEFFMSYYPLSFIIGEKREAFERVLRRELENFADDRKTLTCIESMIQITAQKI